MYTLFTVCKMSEKLQVWTKSLTKCQVSVMVLKCWLVIHQKSVHTFVAKAKTLNNIANFFKLFYNKQKEIFQANKNSCNNVEITWWKPPIQVYYFIFFLDTPISKQHNAIEGIVEAQLQVRNFWDKRHSFQQQPHWQIVRSVSVCVCGCENWCGEQAPGSAGDQLTPMYSSGQNETPCHLHFSSLTCFSNFYICFLKKWYTLEYFPIKTLTNLFSNQFRSVLWKFWYLL